MVDFLAEGSVDVVLCDWNFLDGTWKEALREIQGRYPRLPSIVISPTQGIEEGIQEWLDVLSAGAFDLLLNPSNDLSLRSVLEHAVASGEGRMMHAGM
jgi:DNA-binding NtrC family response regulator